MTDITVTAKKNFKPATDKLYVYIDNIVFEDFSSFEFSRDIETIPGTFSFSVPCDQEMYPENIKQNAPVVIFLHKKQIFHGYMEQFSFSVSGNNQHLLTISGRSKLRDLTDSNPIIAGTAIQNVQGISDICAIICEPYNIKYQNLSKSADKTAWNSVPFNLGDTGFSVISRYATYEGKLLYENGYGDLIIDDVATTCKTTFDSNTQISAAQFVNDITNRYKEYHVYWQPFTTQSQTGLPPVKIAYDPEQSVWGNTVQRTKVLINSTSDENGSIAQRLAQFEANRQYGRSKSLQIVLPDWKDSDNFYDINQLINVNLPLIHCVNVQMVICSVSYFYSTDAGSVLTLTLYPKEALSFQPVALFNASPSLQSLPESQA